MGRCSASVWTMNNVPSNESMHRALGLTDAEYERILEMLGREPNPLELTMFSVMWSEHCSYKSSRIHLRRFPSDGDHVLVGPGEGAGVIDVGDGIAIAIRIESHNHPTAIDPYEGAGTGLGGILRDVYSMGARPIAAMDPLRVGSLDDDKSRWIAREAVKGLSEYSNVVGVPVVGGESVFDRTYDGNPLANVFCVGILAKEHLVLARAEGVGNIAVLLGETTGRDGIGGVSAASVGFTEDDDQHEDRPTVAAGDPHSAKALIEACLEMLGRDLAVGVQDLGGAGLTCATSETAAKAGMGMDVMVGRVHLREEGMQPFEVMTSESQERMLAIVRPDDLDEVLGIADRWGVTAVVVGTVTDSGNLRVIDDDGAVLGDIPADALDSGAPLYERDMAPPADLVERQADVADLIPAPSDAGADLVEMLADPSFLYGGLSQVGPADIVVPPGGDAAVLRLTHPVTGVDTGGGLAMTTDGNHLWCSVDPRRGSAMIVAESVMNLATVGARPMAMVNCLNYGNPEHPEVMWQLSESIDGLSEALRAFDVPCVGGNVSFYNESMGEDIDPTPVIGVVGVVDDIDRTLPGTGMVEGASVILIGETLPELSGSQWAANRGHRGRGILPALDLESVAHNAAAVRSLVADDRVVAVHDVSGGGLAVALAEMALASGIGFSVTGVDSHAELFSESAGRAVACVAADEVDAVVEQLRSASVPASVLGTGGGSRMTVAGQFDLDLATVTDRWSSYFADALGSDSGS